MGRPSDPDILMWYDYVEPDEQALPLEDEDDPLMDDDPIPPDEEDEE